jgi:hypothetical protein
MDVRPLTPLEYLQVKARKDRIKKYEKPDLIPPDAMCLAYDRPKAAFYTEEKATRAMAVAQQRRKAEGNVDYYERRYYWCPHPPSKSHIRAGHLHLTSKTREELDAARREAQDDVSED